MAEYTLIKIDALPDGTANLGSKVMFGIGDKIHTTTVAQMLSLFVENNSITPRQVPINLLVTSSNFSAILLNVNLTIAQNEIVFLTFNALFNNRATLNTYLVPLGAGIYNPLGAEIGFNGLILINEKPIEDLESDTNTVTYTVAGLSEINDAVVPFDFSDETKVYFVIFGGSLYRFVGELGLYGDGELQISISDLELISTQGDNDFIEKQSFAYLPISSLDEFSTVPNSLNFVTTDGDGVSSFSGFSNGTLFIGQRMIIRNDKTTDFPLNRFVPTPPITFDFTFDRNYIVKAGDNIEFDFTASGFRQVGIDAIPRKGTAEGFPITGDLEFAGDIIIGDVTRKIEFKEESLKIGFENTSGASNIEFYPDKVQVKNLLVGDFDYSDSAFNPLVYTQGSYILGVEKSANFTAQNNGRYRTTATLTITDTETEDYFVQVQAGVCTIGGVAYVAGDWIWRVGATSYKINGSGGVSIYITANTTAVNNARYIANGTLTVSDIASPVAGSNFEVIVRGGSVTVGGQAYSEGVVIQRIHNGTSWASYVFDSFGTLTITFTSASTISTANSWQGKLVKINTNGFTCVLQLNHKVDFVAGKYNGGTVEIIAGTQNRVLADNQFILTGNYDTLSVVVDPSDDTKSVIYTTIR